MPSVRGVFRATLML